MSGENGVPVSEATNDQKTAVEASSDDYEASGEVRQDDIVRVSLNDRCHVVIRVPPTWGQR